jgi:O-6-methylguanine DNA methyltransferase
MTQSIHTSPYGTYMVTETEKGISEISFSEKIPKKIIIAKRADIDFSNPKSYKYDLVGTPFQKEVWKALMKIKPGQTKTYKEVAEMIGKPTAVRAVASAIAKNNIAILVPCHRVIRADGKIGEFRWGTNMKMKLLQTEGVQV